MRISSSGAALSRDRERFDAGDRARPHQILNPLIVPVLASGQASVVGTPLDELLLELLHELKAVQESNPDVIKPPHA